MPVGRTRSLERSIRHTHGAVSCVTSSCRYVGTFASADAYPQSLQPPHPSPAVGKNARYPRRLRTPEPPPTLEALLYAKEAQRSSPPRPGTLECPPKLAQAIDSISRVPGKRLSRRREANARWRWLSEHMSKLRLPLGVTVAPMGTKQLSGAEDAWNALRTSSIGGLESRAQSHGTSVPRRVARTQKAKDKGGEKNASFGKVQPALDPEPLAPYLLAAHRSAERWSMPPVHPRAKKRLRRTAWVRSRVDYFTRHRARRRHWARLLSASPLIQLQAPGDMRRRILAHTQALDQQAPALNRGDASGLRGTRSALHALNTALAQRPAPAGSAGAAASKRGAGAPALHTKISPHALYSGRGRRRPPPATRAALSEEELAWIRGSE